MHLSFYPRRILSPLGICAAIALSAAAASAQPDPAAPAPSDAPRPSGETPGESVSPPAPAAPESAKPAPEAAPSAKPQAPKGSPIAPLRVTAVPGEEPSHSRLQWNEKWPRVTLLEHTTMALSGLGTFVANELSPRHTGRWDNAFDTSVRDAVRLESLSGRRAIATTSDLFFYTLMSYPILVDTLFVAGLRNSDVAWQMTVMNLNSLALSGMISVLGERLAGRERPFVRECANDPNYDPDCDGDGLKKDVSFPSGHTIMASTGAGLICAHHLNLPLYGGGWPDILTCGTAVTMAGAQGLFRIMADRHYASDVIIVSLVGFSSGFLLPTLLHYRGGKSTPPRVSVAPFASDTSGGLMASGTL